MRLDEEQKTKAMARESLANAERRAHTLQNALEESRTMLEQADRARRAAEQELQDCNESLSDLNAQNQSLIGSKRRVEAETETVKQELDDVTSEARMAEDKAHRTMLDAAKLADELRMEQVQNTIKVCFELEYMLELTRHSFLNSTFGAKIHFFFTFHFWRESYNFSTKSKLFFFLHRLARKFKVFWNLIMPKHHKSLF